MRLPALAAATCMSFEFDWFIELSVSVVIGQSNYFGFGFTAISWKPLKRVDKP